MFVAWAREDESGRIEEVRCGELVQILAMRFPCRLLMRFVQVLVSYGTLEASFRRQQRGFKRGDKFIKEKSPMHEFEWYR